MIFDVFYDMMPTFCELIGAEIPMQADGKSMLPTFLGKSQEQHDYLFWEYPEYGGQQAIRMGDWKGIRTNIKREGNLKIELYDLSVDVLEQNDVSDLQPEIIEKMKKIFNQEHKESSLNRFKMKALGDKLN